MAYTVQMAFFPGFLLAYQWKFIPNMSWFAITLVTIASFADTVGRILGSYVDFIPKRHFLVTSILRGLVFTAICYLMKYNILVSVFQADWFMVVFVFLFASSCGYWTALGMKYGSDEETID